ncbi:MAG: bacteriocin-protection protein [Chloroflexi bacterium]|nr:bacteriocin-protection protein [Chloroflexota bacterium]
MDATFFKSPAEWRAWLEKNHATETSLLLGFYKKGSGKLNMTYQQSLDVALCFGWIDGVRGSLNDEAYTMRYSQRKTHSIWSAVNIKRIGELAAEGLVHPYGQKVFDERDQSKQNSYSHEQEKIELPPDYETQFRANETAWADFQQRPPSYKKAALWWVISAKQEATRLKRLATLIEDSAAGRKIALLTRKSERE